MKAQSGPDLRLYSLSDYTKAREYAGILLAFGPPLAAFFKECNTPDVVG